MPRRIGIYLGSEPKDGGAFQYSQTMLEAVASLPDDRYTVLVAYSSDVWRSRADSVGLLSVHLPRTKGARILHRAVGLSFLPWSLWRSASARLDPVVSALRAEQRDLWVFPAQDSLSYQSGVPALVSVHDLMHLYERSFPESASALEFAYRQRHYAAICRYASGVLVDSTCGKDQLVESFGIDPQRVHVLPFVAPPRGGSALAPPVPLPEKFLFYPAQFWRHKNHLALVQAAALLKDRAPDLCLVFAGAKKNGYEALAREIRRLGVEDRVLCLGYVSDEQIQFLYSRARALVMPTFYGPTNIPPLEAFAAGCPVAVSGVYGMPEQVGDAALLFDPTDVTQIAETMLRIWTDDDLCRDLIRRGHERCVLTGQDSMNARMVETLDKILGTQPARG